ncbi:IS3 family transposase [Nocardia sp. NEAU-G5]|uniref:IS3 family transposase n=1 Tax=Nocardia albiluteola TaxID=2842303 RepID=A0ABS6B1S3_9NOCA|nr:IS3 family transposase [Nocardia albiluteola]MBU3064248.1 IS3 family transposase [Nocardia albiluteola]
MRRAGGDLPKRKYAIVERLIARGHSGRAACRIAGLNRATFHRLRKPALSIRFLRRTIVADEIGKIHLRSRGSYGRRRIQAALLSECDMVVNHKLIHSIMGELQLSGLPLQKGRKPNLLGVHTPSDLVNRMFVANKPNELWCTDITEHPTRDGKVYCCAILDCFSKKVVGRSFSTIPDAALVNNAVNMAVRERKRYHGAILHADHGTQITSWSFGENLRRHNLIPSFGTVGDCFDNAAIEAFWGRMQTELLNTRKWPTSLELTIAMADWIDNFYNAERLHSYLGHLSPDEYEMLWHATQPESRLS